MAKSVKTKNPIYIGLDGKGPLIEVQIKLVNGKYEVEPLIHHDVNNERLITLRDNLKSLLSVQENNGVLSLNIIGKDKNSNTVTRSLGTITKGAFLAEAPLTTLEVKMLSLGRDGNNYDRVFASGEKVPSPKTDLHTHYTGQLPAREVYEIALKTAPKTVEFRTDLLVKNGILDSNHNFGDKATLDVLNKIPGFKEKLINSMEVNIQDQITFMDMDELYSARGPFFDSSNPNLIKNYILKIAENYAKNGVEYCELSTCTWMFQGCSEEENKERHKIFSSAVKEAQKKYGVTVAFLLATPRVKRDDHSMMGFTRAFINEANTPFVAGIDLLGHEKTSNKDYSYIFAAAANLCAKNGWKHFTIRSHAGESDEHKDNIKDFLKSVTTEIDALKKSGEIKDKDFYPDIRIGHGLHGGLDDETLELIKKTGAIIEINASSNMSLNNITELSQIPIRKYLDKGVRVVLGSDGAGLYGTDAKQEVLIAHQLGVSVKELRDMVDFERLYIKDKIREASLRGKDKEHQYVDYIPETVDLPGIQRIEVNYNTQEINKEFEQDMPIFICGAEKTLDNPELEEILRKDVSNLIKHAKDAKKRICIYNDGSHINDLVIEACAREHVNLIKLESIPVKEGSKAYGIDKFEVSRSLGKFYGKNHGKMFVLGGGAFASDLIVNCENNHVDWRTDESIPGASKDQGKMRANDKKPKQIEVIKLDEIQRRVDEYPKKKASNTGARR